LRGVLLEVVNVPGRPDADAEEQQTDGDERCGETED
jgi:hypothetical protein